MDPAARQRRHRAIEAIRVAAQIVIRSSWDRDARVYRDRLREAPAGGRRRILREYSQQPLGSAASLAQE
jgi:hypothetical protein